MESILQQSLILSNHVVEWFLFSISELYSITDRKGTLFYTCTKQIWHYPSMQIIQKKAAPSLLVLTADSNSVHSFPNHLIVLQTHANNISVFLYHSYLLVSVMQNLKHSTKPCLMLSLFSFFFLLTLYQTKLKLLCGMSDLGKVLWLTHLTVKRQNENKGLTQTLQKRSQFLQHTRIQWSWTKFSQK